MKTLPLLLSCPLLILLELALAAGLSAADPNPIGGGEIGVRIEMGDTPSGLVIPNSVPEPSSLALLALGAAGVVIVGSRRGRSF